MTKILARVFGHVAALPRRRELGAIAASVTHTRRALGSRR